MTTLEKGVAPIKAEFLLPIVHKRGDKEESTTKGGMNKKRPFDYTLNEPDLCLRSAIGETCLDQKCKKEHNVSLYMHQKIEDFGTVCPMFDIFGECPYGLKCRFHQHHTIKVFLENDEEKVYYLQKKEIRENTEKEKVKSPFTADVIYQLHKRTLPFPKTKILLEQLNRENIQERKKMPLEILAEQQGLSKEKPIGPLDTETIKRKIDFRGKTYLAPLTTVGNLPFRRICKDFGVDITCGEMALDDCILDGQLRELALLKKHPSEDIFGVQICGGKPESLWKVTELLNTHYQSDLDFIDLNLGCPIDMVFKKGNGSGLLQKPRRLEQILKGMTTFDLPVSVKLRTGIYSDKRLAKEMLPLFKRSGVQFVTLHGRSRQQRYTKEADWQYIKECSNEARRLGLSFFGNGDCFSPQQFQQYREEVDGVMIGRGALIKPWIFQELKNGKLYDISATERFDILKRFCEYGLQHWGSDQNGFNKTRRYLLEWLSFQHRYIPVGILEYLPQRMNDRPPKYRGRNELETLMASERVEDWVKLSERLLGKVPEGFKFIPKHKSNSYSSG